MQTSYMQTKHVQDRWKHVVILAGVAMLLSPAVTLAGSHMDSKSPAASTNLLNDTQTMTVKLAKIDYSPVIAPSVTTQVECNVVNDGSTDLTCSSRITYNDSCICDPAGTTCLPSV